MVATSNLRHYLLLIRPINIAVVALTMLLFRYCIIDVKLYRAYDFLPYLNSLSFYVLLITTLFVTAGGYVINDIYDVEIDQINKPDKLIVGKHLSDTQAFNFYLGLTGVAVAGSFLLMFTSGQMKISMLPIFVIGLLFVYASTFKRMPLIGNITIAVCAALPIILLSIYELRINDFDPAAVILFTQGIGLAAIIYGTFAFLTTLIRELIKDLQDMSGDDEVGSRTLPIAIGTTATKVIIISIQLLTLTLILAIAYYTLVAKISIAFYSVLAYLVLPLVVQIILTIWAKQPKHYQWASSVGKVHMILGVLTLLYFASGTAPHFFDQLFKLYLNMLQA